MIVKETIKRKEELENIQKVSRNFLEGAIDKVITKVDFMIERFPVNFPWASSENLKYIEVDNNKINPRDGNWTTSFWTGMLWLAYEHTGEDKYRKLAETHIESFERRLKEKVSIDTHDLGFLYTLSCVAGYKLTGCKKAKETAIGAADYLITRFHEKAEIIQAWGNLSDPNEMGRMIIDCNMNLPLLYWATEVTGNEKYRNVALKHIERSKKYTIREDASTHHTYYFDTKTGKPIGGKTAQGASDDSAWARGQAWGVYGLMLTYDHNNDKELINTSKKLANYFINRTPEDLVPYWDLMFTEESHGEPRDSSSTAIVMCGLLEMLKHIPQEDKDRKIYEGFINKALVNLDKDYVSTSLEEDGVLLHGTYGKPQKNGIDEFCIWGDYYYFEALMRAYKNWNPYW